MTNNDLYDFGLRIVRLIENDDLYVKALIVKDAEIERLREALKFYKCSCTEEQFKTCNEYMCGHKAQLALKEVKNEN